MLLIYIAEKCPLFILFKVEIPVQNCHFLCTTRRPYDVSGL